MTAQSNKSFENPNGDLGQNLGFRPFSNRVFSEAISASFDAFTAPTVAAAVPASILVHHFYSLYLPPTDV